MQNVTVKSCVGINNSEVKKKKICVQNFSMLIIFNEAIDSVTCKHSSPSLWILNWKWKHYPRINQLLNERLYSWPALTPPSVMILGSRNKRRNSICRALMEISSFPQSSPSWLANPVFYDPASRLMGDNCDYSAVPYSKMVSRKTRKRGRTKIMKGIWYGSCECLLDRRMI